MQPTYNVKMHHEIMIDNGLVEFDTVVAEVKEIHKNC